VLVIGMIVMSVALLGWVIVNLAIAIGRPLGPFSRVKVLAIFTVLPEPWDRIVGASANVVMGLGLWGLLAYYVWLR
jgi:hypothetical protein